MFRKVTTVILTILLILPALANEKSDVQKAKRSLDRAERSLQSLESSFRKRPSVNESVLRSWNLKLEKARVQLDKANTLLASYGSAEAQAQKSRATQVEQRLGQLQKRVSQRAEGLTKAEALASSSQGQEATQEFQNLANLFRNVNAYLLNVKEDPKLIDAYRQGLQARTQLREKYAAVLGSSSNATFDLRAAASQAEMNLKGLNHTIERAKKEFPPVVERHLKKALEDAESLQKTGAYGAWEVNVEPELRYARLRVEKLKSVTDPSVTGAMEARVENVTRQLDGVQQKFKAQIIANNKPPADRFRGSDAGAVKAAVKSKWASQYPGDKVTDIRIMDPAWSGFSGLDWDGGSRVWRPYNFDRVRAAVIVSSGSSRYKFGALVVRQNLGGGGLEVFPDRPDPVTDPKMMLP